MRRLLLNVLMVAMLIVSADMSLSAQDATAASTYNEGLAQLKEKDYANGLMNMEKALELATAAEDEKIMGLAKKNGAVAAYNVGNAARKAKDYDAAMTAYNKGIEMNPDYSSNYEGVARTLEAQGDKMGAVDQYLKAASMAKANGKTKRYASRMKKVQVMVGKSFVAKKHDDAIAMGDKYLAVDDTNADVYYYLARAKQATDALDDAAGHMTKAIEISGDAAESKFHFYLGEILEKKGDKAGAAASYRKVTDEKYKAQADYRAGQLEG